VPPGKAASLTAMRHETQVRQTAKEILVDELLH
jgi:hypothetical protein